MRKPNEYKTPFYDVSLKRRRARIPEAEPMEIEDVGFGSLPIFRKRFPVITLCGSTKFEKEFREIEEKLALKGWLVISVSVFSLRDKIHDPHEPEFIELKNKLDQVHKQKINMSNAIFVINKDGYIGESTRSEIEYASFHHKKIFYLEE